MTALRSPATAAEPTPQFEEQCRAIYKTWQTGQLSFRDAVEQLSVLAGQAAAEGHLANQGRVEHLLGNLQHHRGNLNTSIMHFERARACFEQVGSRSRMAMMDLNLGEAYRYKGDFTRARQLYRKAYDAARALDMLDVMTFAIANEGLMLVHMNRFDTARAALEEGFALAQRWTHSDQNLPSLLSEIHAGLAHVYLRHNDPHAAWTHALRAFENARASDEAVKTGIARCVIADVLTILGEVPEADRDAFAADPDIHYQDAINTFREVRAEAELAHAIFAHGRSLALRGRSLRAARQFQQAMILYTRLDMVADAARAASAQLDVTA